LRSDGKLSFLISGGKFADIHFLFDQVLKKEIPKDIRSEIPIDLIIINASQEDLDCARGLVNTYSNYPEPFGFSVRPVFLRLDMNDSEQVTLLRHRLVQRGYAGSMQGIMHNLGGATHQVMNQAYVDLLYMFCKDGGWLQLDPHYAQHIPESPAAPINDALKTAGFEGTRVNKSTRYFHRFVASYFFKGQGVRPVLASLWKWGVFTNYFFRKDTHAYNERMQQSDLAYLKSHYGHESLVTLLRRYGVWWRHIRHSTMRNYSLNTKHLIPQNKTDLKAEWVMHDLRPEEIGGRIVSVDELLQNPIVIEKPLNVRLGSECNWNKSRYHEGVISAGAYLSFINGIDHPVVLKRLVGCFRVSIEREIYKAQLLSISGAGPKFYGMVQVSENEYVYAIQPTCGDSLSAGAGLNNMYVHVPSSLSDLQDRLQRYKIAYFQYLCIGNTKLILMDADTIQFDVPYLLDESYADHVQRIVDQAQGTLRGKDLAFHEAA